MTRIGDVGLALVNLLCFASFVCLPLGWPIFQVVLDASVWSLTVSDLPRVGQLFLTTGKLILCSSLLSISAGIVLSLYLYRTKGPGRSFILFALVLGAFAPLSMYAGGWLSIVGPNGVLELKGGSQSRWGGFLSAVIVHGLAAIPWSVAAISAGLLCIRRDFEEQASLEMNHLQVLMRVTLPLLAPALLSAVAITAVPILTDMTVTDLYVVRTFAEEVYTQYESGGDTRSAVLLTIPAGLVVLVGLWPLLHLARGTYARVEAQESNQATFPSGATVLVGILAACVMGLALVPFGGLVRQLGLKTSQVDSSHLVWNAHTAWTYLTQAVVPVIRNGLLLEDLGRSLFVGLLSTTIAVIFSWQWRKWRTPARVVTALLVASLFVLPGPVLGLTLIQIFNRPGGLGFIYDSWLILVIAQIVRTLPLATLLTILTIGRQDQPLVDMARSEGMSDATILARIAVPAHRFTLAFSLILCTALALNELPTTKLVAPPGTDPLALRTFQLLHGGTGNEQAAQCLLILFTVLTLTFAATAVRWLFSPCRPSAEDRERFKS